MQHLKKHLSAAQWTYGPNPLLRWLARFFLPAAFLCFVVPLCIVLASITPPGAGPDEVTHALRADGLTHGQLLATRRVVQGPDGPRIMLGFKVHPAILSTLILMTGSHKKETADTLAQIHAVTWAEPRTFMDLTGAAPYPPMLYVPAALAIGVVRVAQGSPLHAIYAARLADVAVFGMLGLLALLVARRGQAILFWALSVPMTVSLAALISPEGMLVGGAALAMALLTRVDASDSATRHLGRAWIGAAVLIGLLAMVKPPYACLAAGLLLPLRPFDKALLRRACYAALTILPAILWTAFAMWRLTVAWRNDFGQYHPGPLWPGAADAIFHLPNAAAQLQVLAVKPWRPFWLSWHSLANDPWIARMIIGILGSEEIVLPQWLYSLWGVSAAAACLATILSPGKPTAMRPSWGDSLLLFVAAMLGIVAIYMALYLSWTRVGAIIVEGVQGRYMLPLIPMLALALPSLRVRQANTLATLLGLPGVAAAAAGLVVVPLLIVSTFYIR